MVAIIPQTFGSNYTFDTQKWKEKKSSLHHGRLGNNEGIHSELSLPETLGLFTFGEKREFLFLSEHKPGRTLVVQIPNFTPDLVKIILTEKSQG